MNIRNLFIILVGVSSMALVAVPPFTDGNDYHPPVPGDFYQDFAPVSEQPPLI